MLTQKQATTILSDCLSQRKTVPKGQVIIDPTEWQFNYDMNIVDFYNT